MVRPLDTSKFNIVHCLNCGKELRSYFTNAGRKWCSIKCRAEYVRKGQVCLVCHKPLKEPKSHNHILCSLECRYEYQKLNKGIAHKHEVIAGYKRHAKKKNLEFALSSEKIDQLFSGDCYWCGAKPENGVTSSRGIRNNGIFIYNGIDRIDSRLGYVEGNCVSCCIRCNSMKREFTPNDFLERVKRIALKWELV